MIVRRDTTTKQSDLRNSHNLTRHALRQKLCNRMKGQTICSIRSTLHLPQSIMTTMMRAMMMMMKGNEGDEAGDETGDEVDDEANATLAVPQKHSPHILR